MGKRTALFFIIMANIIMLAHLILPHHNHILTVEPCKITSHTLNSPKHVCPHNDTQKFIAKNESGKHIELNFEDCLLEDIHLRFDNQNQIEQNNDFDFQSFVFTIFHSDSDITQIETLTLNPTKPYLIKPYHNTFVRTTGLRAPPFC